MLFINAKQFENNVQLLKELMLAKEKYAAELPHMIALVENRFETIKMAAGTKRLQINEQLREHTTNIYTNDIED